MISKASPVRRIIQASGANAFGLVLFVLQSSIKDASAQDLPVDTGSQIPVAIWFVGAAVLGLVMAYGILRTRNRTRAEQITEQATKQVYAEEEDGLEARMCK